MYFLLFLCFSQDKADVLTPAIKSEKEDISKEDLLTIKETLCSDREREELEKIKEDREEYQEVRTQLSRVMPLCAEETSDSFLIF